MAETGGEKPGAGAEIEAEAALEAEAGAGGAALLRLAGVTRHFREGRAGLLEVLRGVDLALAPGELVGLVGPSGAGKSTLLHVTGLLETPSGGRIRLAGRDCTRLGDRARTRLRRETIGMVYQHHHLLAEFTAAENVAMPQLIAGTPRRAAAARARALLDRVGLAARLDHRPAELSGGERQRVAFARAVANAPRLLLADEPTGNLDQHTAARVFDLLVDLVRETGLAAIVATHNPDLARRMDRVVALSEGVLVPA